MSAKPNHEPTEAQVAAAAQVIADSPLIDAPKLPYTNWMGLARHVLEVALKSEPPDFREMSMPDLIRLRDRLNMHLHLRVLGDPRATEPGGGHDPKTASKPNSQTAVAVQSEPEGWVSVPLFATPEMIEAAQTVVLIDYSYAPGTDMSKSHAFQIDHINECSASEIWEAMLSASPRVPELSVGEQKQEPKP